MILDIFLEESRKPIQIFAKYLKLWYSGEVINIFIMSIEHTTRAITENKFMMQLFADRKSLDADITALKKLKASNPTDSRASDSIIKQKEYELSQIDYKIKGKDYASVKSQCEKYFSDNSTLFDKEKIIGETRLMLSR